MTMDDHSAATGGSDLRDERFRIEAPLQIATLLNELARRRALVSVAFGTDVMVTVLLNADPGTGVLVFDAGSNADANSRLIDAKRLAFETHLDRIRVVFYTDGATAWDWDKAPAFAVRFPASVQRIQRRDYFRAYVPMASSIRCDLPAGVDARPAPVALRVFDISVTGVALVDGPADFQPAPGTVLHDAVFALPPKSLKVDLEVMYRRQSSIAGSDGTQSLVRYGCRFVSLPPGGEALIQRCINQLERERKTPR